MLPGLQLIIKDKTFMMKLNGFWNKARIKTGGIKFK